MRALVTGCAGFIGSHLAEAILGDGDHVVGIDCFNANYGRGQKLRNIERCHDWDGFEFVPIDLARGELHDLVAECDTVFHLAAEPGTRGGFDGRFEAYLRNNVLSTQHLLEAARTWPEKRFVYASSSSVYGQAESFPTPEEATPRPRSPYGATKLAGEHLCSVYRASHGVQTVVLRYFSVYGPRQRPDMAFSIFCRAAARGEQVTVFGDGRQTRDFTYVDDAVAATRAAAEAPGGTYNIGGGARTSLARAIELIQELAGRPLETDALPAQDGDVRDTAADIERARRVLGFEPGVDLASGLAAQFEWALRHDGQRARSY